MKLCTFELLNEPSHATRIGALNEEHQVVDLQLASDLVLGAKESCFADMLALLDAGDHAMDQTRRLLERVSKVGASEPLRGVDSIRLLSPLPRPRSIRDCMSFERHLVQATRTVVKWRFPPLASLDAWLERRRGKSLLAPPKVWYERPVYYKGNPQSVVGPDCEVRWPSYTERLDYELEFGLFIGRSGRDILEEEALDYVAGYSIFNDFSARDTQLSEMQGRLGPAKGKDFDTGNVIGPYLVTSDEISDPHDLRMSARVNGETWSDSSSSEMHFRFEQIIAYISRDETLMPGDFIAAGTAPGGCGLELDRWLQPNDEVELEVEQLGVLRNRVIRP